MLVAPDALTTRRHPTTYPPNSSDEFPPQRAEPPRNATPGPSNVPRTLSPTLEANNGDLQARYKQFPPSAYDPNNLPSPEQAMVPVRPRPIMAFPSAPSERIVIRPPPDAFPPMSPAARRMIASSDSRPQHQDTPRFAPALWPTGRFPERTITIHTDDEEDPDVPHSISGSSSNPSPPPRSPSDPLNPNGLDYEWPDLSTVDREILGPQHSQAWEL
ncbi:hypothetical protein ARMSODRAFT_1019399 [Armillaria solidipes]|uniref:Uncharacterized protein n=1 Tax=Armillaria solidipes TaxID=1076256 RepID=A0A2H3BD75_9AGAR|nr:hypothetical protein ARMSODRAFT_1019399 [Armillaria solidipes]